MRDLLDRELKVGDAIVYAEGRRDIAIGNITSFGKKMVSVKKYGGSYDARHIYPEHVLKVTDLPELMIYLLKKL